MDPIESYIRTAATQRGMDPDYAASVYHGEGASAYAGDSGSSFGPFQLHYGGVAGGGNAVSGLGDVFTKQTGLDARDPSTIKQQIDFSLDYANKNGWSAWHGAPGALSQNTGTPRMPTNDQGVLSSTYGLPPGALGGGGIEGVGTALQGAGAWLQSANNPGGAAAMLSGVNEQQQNKLRMLLAAKPEWTTIGTGVFGPRYGWVSPLAAMRAQATGGAPQGGQAAPGGTPGVSVSGSGNDIDTGQMEDAIGRYQQGKASAQDVLNATPSIVSDYAKTLVSGQADPSYLGNRATMMKPAAMVVAHILDPNFNENDITERKTVARGLGNTAPSSFGGQVNSANTIMSHLTVMHDAMDVLKQEGVLGSSVVGNYGTQAFSDYVSRNPRVQAALASYNKGLQGAAGEMTKITRGGNGSLQEVQDWKADQQPYQPEAKLRSGLATMIDMMHGRLDSNVAQYNNAYHTNKTARDFMTDKAQSAEDRILGADQYGPQGTGGGQQQSAAAPAAPATSGGGEVRYHNGKAYTRGPNGEAVPVQ